MNKIKIIIISIIILLLVIIFLYPKPCDRWTTAPKSNIPNDHCSCLGIKKSGSEYGGGGINSCIGIPLSYSCSLNEIENGRLIRVNTPCLDR